MRRDDRCGSSGADIGRGGNGDAVYVDAEYPGTGEAEQSMNENPDKCTGDEHGSFCEAGNGCARTHSRDKDINQRRAHRRGIWQLRCRRCRQQQCDSRHEQYSRRGLGEDGTERRVCSGDPTCNPRSQCRGGPGDNNNNCGQEQVLRHRRRMILIDVDIRSGVHRLDYFLLNNR